VRVPRSPCHSRALPPVLLGRFRGVRIWFKPVGPLAASQRVIEFDLEQVGFDRLGNFAAGEGTVIFRFAACTGLAPDVGSLVTGGGG